MDTDRFSSREDVDFHPEAESQGRIARLNEFSADDPGANPYKPGTWLYHSFCAGWADADQSMLADIEAAELRSLLSLDRKDGA